MSSTMDLALNLFIFISRAAYISFITMMSAFESAGAKSLKSALVLVYVWG